MVTEDGVQVPARRDAPWGPDEYRAATSGSNSRADGCPRARLGFAPRADVHERRGQVRPVARHGRRRRGQPGSLERRLAVEMMDRSVPPDRADLCGEGRCSSSSRYAATHEWKTTSGAASSIVATDTPQIGEHVAALEAWWMRRAADVRQGGAQAAEADRVIRPLAGEEPLCRVVRERVDGGRGRVRRDLP